MSKATPSTAAPARSAIRSSVLASCAHLVTEASSSRLAEGAESVHRGVARLGAPGRGGDADDRAVLLLDHEADGAGGQQGGELGHRHLPEVQLGDLDLGLHVPGELHQPVEQAPELQGREQPADLLDVPLPHHGVLGLDVERDVGDDPREVLVEDQAIARGLDVLLEPTLQLVGVGQEVLDRPVLLDQLGGGLLADARDARDVVRGVALERHVLEVPGRRQAVAILDPRLVDPGDVGDPAAVEEHLDPRPDELEEVPVGGDDRRLDPRSQARIASVPIASSASWSVTSSIGIRRDSTTSWISPSCGRKSSGVSRRPALYSASIASRATGLPTSKATAIRSGRSSASSLINIEVKP